MTIAQLADRLEALEKVVPTAGGEDFAFRRSQSTVVAGGRRSLQRRSGVRGCIAEGPPHAR